MRAICIHFCHIEHATRTKGLVGDNEQKDCFLLSYQLRRDQLEIPQDELGQVGEPLPDRWMANNNPPAA